LKKAVYRPDKDLQTEQYSVLSGMTGTEHNRQQFRYSYICQGTSTKS